MRAARTKTSFVFALLFSSGVLVASSLPYPRPARAEASTAGASKAGSTTTPRRQGCCGVQDTDADKPHLLAASYYSLNHGFTATLMLNNKGPKPIEVKPTLFSLDGQRLELQSITVEGMSFREVNMRDFGIAGTAFQEGSLQLFHRGKDLVLGAQVKMVDMRRSLIYEEKLLEVQTEVGQQRLEGVWWLPSRRGEVKLVLSNTGDAPLSVAATVDGSAPKQKDAFTLTLSAHETRVIDAQQDVVGKRGGALAEVGGITLEHTGDAGALLARVLMQDAAAGYSVSARFYDPQKGKSTKLHGAGLRLGSVAGKQLTPVVVARNVGGSRTTVTGRIPYTRADGSDGTASLPDLRLAPGEAGVVDVKSALQQNGIEGGVASAGLEFEYTNEPGSVIMLAQSVSKDGDHAFTVPMWDILAQRSSTGGYPWKIEDGTTTLAYIKNVTDEPQKYVLSILFEGGAYTTGLNTVEPGQTRVIDVRALRDGQIPNEQGVKIPPAATRGQIQWSIKGPKNLVMVGRSEQVDAARGISTSYACQNCCPDSFNDGWLVPGRFNDYITYENDVTQFQAFENTVSCYGYVSSGWLADSVFWESSDYDLLYVNYLGSATGGVSGAGIIGGSWTADSWFMGLSNYCEYTPLDVLREAFFSIVPDVTFTDVTLHNTSANFDFLNRATLNARNSGRQICGQPFAQFTLIVDFTLPNEATGLSTTRSSAQGFGTTADREFDVDSFEFQNVNLTSTPKRGQMVINAHSRGTVTPGAATPFHSISIRVAGDFPRGSVEGTFTGRGSVSITCP